jgi:rare lipoprotein A
VKRQNHKLLWTTLIAISVGVACSTSAAQAAEKSPEVASSVWEESNMQCASVSINGKDLIAFHAPAGSHSAEQRAEDLADKLQGLVEDDKFDASKIIPAREGELASIRLDGSTVLKFDCDDKSNPLDTSLKVVNSIRTACGVDALPASMAKVAEAASDKAAAATKGIAKLFSGPASWYGPHFHGKKCSDGSRFDMNKLTAAHRFLPFGTRLLVTNRKTGASCVVKVNDRGPFVGNRVIDLSRGAAKQLDMLGTGVAMVDCVVLGQ